MRSLALIALGSLIASTSLTAQSIAEHAAAVGGAAIGTAAGKPLGTAIGKIFTGADSTTSKAANHSGQAGGAKGRGDCQRTGDGAGSSEDFCRIGRIRGIGWVRIRWRRDSFRFHSPHGSPSCSCRCGTAGLRSSKPGSYNSATDHAPGRRAGDQGAFGRGDRRHQSRRYRPRTGSHPRAARIACQHTRR